MLTTVLQGLLMGLAYTAPIGMQNLFVINTAIAETRPRAIATMLFVVLFDVSLLLACYFGAGFAMDTFPWLRRAILLVGGMLVTGIGVLLILPNRSSEKHTDESERQTENDTQRKGLGSLFASAFVVTWCNPQAILDGTMMLGAFRSTLGPNEGMYFLIGACCASFLWFMTLGHISATLGSRLSDRVLRGINIGCGCIVVLYGIRLLWSFFAG